MRLSSTTRARGTLLLAIACASAVQLAAPANGQTAPPTNDTGTPSDVPPPELDLDVLHARWRRLVGPDCAWATYHAGRALSVAEALAAARTDRTVCGPTIYLTGRDSSASIEITQPTVLVGDSGAEISATIVSSEGMPLWVQDVTVRDAPFPGAIFVAHPGAETTLVRVEIESPRGFGIVQQGGYLSAWSSEVRGAQTVVNPAGHPVGAPGRVRADLGQPPREGQVPGDLTLRLSPVVDLLRVDSGPAIDSYLAARLTPAHPFLAVDLAILHCPGSGAYISQGGIVELGSVSFLSNDNAGLVLDDAFAVASNLGAAFNGGKPRDDSSPVPLVYGNKCVGGVHVRSTGALLAEGLSTLFNKPVGLLVDDGFADIGSFTSVGTLSWTGGWGDGLTAVRGSFVVLQDFFVVQNVRAGLLFSESAANLYLGTSTQNKFGLGIQASSVYYDPTAVDLEGNESAIISDGDLPVPNAPLDVPEVN